MEKTITDKTHILCIDNNEKIHLQKEQAEKCKMAVLADKEFIFIGGNLIKKRAIKYILPAKEVERAERIKRGEWICENGEWHQKGERCGHGLMPKSYY